MKSVGAIVLLALSCLSARATITLSIDAAYLVKANGNPNNAGDRMPATGQVLLVADISNTGFGGPTADSFVSGDDVILFRGNLESSFGDGVFSRALTAFDLSPFSGVNQGDHLQLYWFPTLTAASTSPVEGTTYGIYRDTSGRDGSDPWEIPADGGTVNLRFLTASFGGSNPDSAGVANFTVAPIPEASNLITAALAVGLCVLRLACGARQK